MTASVPLELTGIRGDNPLGFLAACGLLYSCNRSNELKGARLAWAWSKTEGALVAKLYAENLQYDCLVNVIRERCAVVRQSLAYRWSTKIDDREKYRDVARRVLTDNSNSRERTEVLAVLAALASDLALRNGVLQSTFLDLTSGNQLFLKSILALAGQRDDRGKKKKKENKDLQQEQVTEEAIREALFGPWQYRDDHHSLGWDPQTQRLHALRHKLPEQDKANRSVRIAVFLASQALPIFPCFVTDHGRFRTTGFFRENGEDWFSWPIWRVPITLETLRSLVTHPFTADLKQRGVDIVYRCRRVRTGGAEGNYQILSHASERPWPR